MKTLWKFPHEVRDLKMISCSPDAMNCIYSAKQCSVAWLYRSFLPHVCSAIRVSSLTWKQYCRFHVSLFDIVRFPHEWPQPFLKTIGGCNRNCPKVYKNENISIRSPQNLPWNCLATALFKPRVTDKQKWPRFQIILLIFWSFWLWFYDFIWFNFTETKPQIHKVALHCKS